jgi:polar amino acid transport system ATP-binding protein
MPIAARDVVDNVVFLRDGVIVERGLARDVIDNPQLPATQAFLSHLHNRG